MEANHKTNNIFHIVFRYINISQINKSLATFLIKNWTIPSLILINLYTNMKIHLKIDIWKHLIAISKLYLKEISFKRKQLQSNTFALFLSHSGKKYRIGDKSKYKNRMEHKTCFEDYPRKSETNGYWSSYHRYQEIWLWLYKLALILSFIVKSTLSK